jgi:phosphoserine phosphatase
MNLVMTLIATACSRNPLAGVAAAVAAILPGRPTPHWLAADEACDLAFDGSDTDAVGEVARNLIGAAGIDMLVQPAAGRRKRLLVADMESTIIENEMLDELADFLGLRPQVAEITRRAMNGEVDFVGALEQRVALLKGMPAGILDEAAARIRLMPGAQALVATMHGNGAETALVSGGFGVFAEPVATALGFDHLVANHLDIADGRIVGTVRLPIVTRDTKRDTLLRLAAERGLSRHETIAVGDGANDLPMLAAAGLGIAFRAKPAVIAAARWRIDHADLTALLYAQGYRREEIAA